MALSRLPSVDKLLSSDLGQRLIALHGRSHVTDVIRDVLAGLRADLQANKSRHIESPPLETIMASVSDRLARLSEATLQPVINLTGTILHTNLGRAPLPAEAIERMSQIAASASNLEYDLGAGQRGERDHHVEHLLQEITGAEAATVVNNNAAAVMLTLNSLAFDRDVPVSRGELVEIGGSFRIPEIMSRSGCRLVEVGATNRTHLDDYRTAITRTTGLIMKVHTSNYEIRGFTNSVGESALAELAREAGIPLVTDLGSGTLVDLTRYGLPGEPTVQAALESGADLVTFSGDKLLGGPQAGLVVGRRDLVDKLRKNPMKRALRVDKLTLAALFEVLKLYRDPDSLPTRLPALRLLTRPAEEILATAQRLQPLINERLSQIARVDIEPMDAQVGSGSLPVDKLPGYGLVITPLAGSEQAVQSLARAFRQLPCPTIGRIHDGRLLLDLRTLVDPSDVSDQLSLLDLS